MNPGLALEWTSLVLGGSISGFPQLDAFSRHRQQPLGRLEKSRDLWPAIRVEHPAPLGRTVDDKPAVTKITELATASTASQV